MCSCRETKQACQKAENVKGKPETCSFTQVRQCHGDVKRHPCTSGKAK